MVLKHLGFVRRRKLKFETQSHINVLKILFEFFYFPWIHFCWSNSSCSQSTFFISPLFIIFSFFYFSIGLRFLENGAIMTNLHWCQLFGDTWAQLTFSFKRKHFCRFKCIVRNHLVKNLISINGYLSWMEIHALALITVFYNILVKYGEVTWDESIMM